MYSFKFAGSTASDMQLMCISCLQETWIASVWFPIWLLLIYMTQLLLTMNVLTILLHRVLSSHPLITRSVGVARNLVWRVQNVGEHGRKTYHIVQCLGVYMQPLCPVSTPEHVSGAWAEELPLIAQHHLWHSLSSLRSRSFHLPLPLCSCSTWFFDARSALLRSHALVSSAADSLFDVFMDA